MILLDVQNVEKQENNKNTIINNLYYSREYRKSCVNKSFRDKI